MEKDLFYQYCLYNASSYWTYSIEDVAHNKNEEFEFRTKFLFSHGIPRFLDSKVELLINDDKISNYRSRLKKLRSNFFKYRLKKDNDKFPVKLASITPLTFIELIAAKFSFSLIPIIFSLGIIFTPLYMFQKTNTKNEFGTYFDPSNDPFYISNGFIEQMNQILSKIYQKETTQTGAPEITFPTLSAPTNVRVVPSETIAINRPIDLNNRINKPSFDNLISQKLSLRKSYVDKYMADISLLFDQVKFQQQTKNGIFSGITLSEIKTDSIFRRMGIKNGDIIIGLDDNKLTSVNDILKVIDIMKTKSNFILHIRSRGLEKRIAYQVR